MRQLADDPLPPTAAAERLLQPHGWLTPASARIAFGLLIVLVLGLAASVAAHLRAQLFDDERRQAELIARVLADHTVRSLETIDLTLATLAGAVERPGGLPGGAEARALIDAALLDSTLQGVAALRSLSLVTPEGQVLASTRGENLGLRIDLARLGLRPGRPIPRLGPLQRARDLDDLQPDAVPVAQPVDLIPMVRKIELGEFSGGYLVAALNPDAFANHYGMTAMPSGHSASLASYDGRLLVAGAEVDAQPGTDLRLVPIWAEHLPQLEHGSLIGAGIDPGEYVVAWRVLRAYPLVVLVERRVSEALAGWQDQTRLIAALGLLGVSALLMLGSLAIRSLSEQAEARKVLAQSMLALRDRERMLSTLVDNVQELMFRTDAEGRIDFVNGRWEPFSGHPHDYAIGRRLGELFVPADRSRIDALFAPGALPAPGAKLMARLQQRGGGERPLEIVVAPLHGPQGKAALAYTGFAIDVSEREQARDALRAQHAVMRRLREEGASAFD